MLETHPVDTMKPLTHSESKVVSNEAFHKPPLYYYRLYKKDRLKVSKKMPLNEHYRKEREVREKIYNLERNANKFREQLTFASNDLKHKILKVEKNHIETETDKHGLMTRVAQRETAMKFQIDHHEAWKTYYMKRKEVNNAKLNKAMPDEVSSIKKLVNFDQDRAAHWGSHAEKVYLGLKFLKTSDRKHVQNLNDEDNHNAKKIIDLKLHLAQINNTGLRKIKDIGTNITALEDELKAYVYIDTE